MPLSRREALTLGGAGLAAALGSWFVVPMLWQRRGIAAALHSASFSDLSGRRVVLSAWRGQVLVCNFWATWCPPCRREIPMLIKVRSEFAASGLEIVGIAADSRANVAEFSRNAGIDYPILFASADVDALMRAAGNPEGALPYTVILDRDGSAAYERLGILDGAVLRAKLRALVRGYRGRAAPAAGMLRKSG
jgi:thiol-disulfide isomerase/thioredoxin